ncbi:hypothetical protein HK098_001407 [Nowakowskiella sp. JEL0407]|nr:hypothetical protein HK098_001407 [Nowakowskiella sp. JEL0407]
MTIISIPAMILNAIVALFTSKQYIFLEGLIAPTLAVFATEVIVDWLKHAFITKFNQLRPAVYSRFRDSLCRDLVSGSKWLNSGKSGSYVDQSPIVARRIGFVSIPLACLTLRIALQTMDMLNMLPTFAVLIQPLTMTWKQFMGHQTSSLSCGIQRIKAHLRSNETLDSTACAENGYLHFPVDGRFWNELQTLAILLISVIVVYSLLLVLKAFVGCSLLSIAHGRVERLREEHNKRMEKEENSLISPVMKTRVEQKDKPAKSEWIPAPGQGAGNRNGNDLVLASEIIDDNQIKVSQDPSKTSDLILDELDIILPPEKLDHIDRFQLVKSRVVV